MIWNLSYRKRSFPFALFLIASSMALAQRQGIKMLVIDGGTGARLRDSVMITFNDSIKRNAVSDTGGFYFFSLPVGVYNVRADRNYYRSSIMSGITVRENKTMYLTIQIVRPEPLKEETKKKKRKKKSLVTGKQ